MKLRVTISLVSYSGSGKQSMKTDNWKTRMEGMENSQIQTLFLWKNSCIYWILYDVVSQSLSLVWSRDNCYESVSIYRLYARISHSFGGNETKLHCYFNMLQKNYIILNDVPEQLFTLLADVEHIPRVDYNDIDYIIIYMLCQIMLANRYFIMSECMSTIV